MQQSPYQTSLPPELWLQILSFVMQRFPMKDLDYKLLRCRNPFRICRKLHRSQPWIARSLLLVCKSWSSIVKPLLYDTVFLSKASQVKDLALMLRGQGLPGADHLSVGSWIKRLVVMISNPKDRIHSSHFGQIMTDCHSLTALHVVMHLPAKFVSTYGHPNSQFFQNILYTASTLHTLNLVSCIPPYDGKAIPSDFFEKMTALRAFRCDNDIVMPNVQLLDYLSIGEWTLEELMDDQPSMAIGELFVRDITSFPIPYPESKHLHRLNLDITDSLLTHRSDLDDAVGGQTQTVHNLPSGSGVELDGHPSEADNPEPDSGDMSGPSEISATSENLQRDALDVLPPTVTYLSIIVRRWEDLGGCIRMQRLPVSVTSLGLEAGEEHCKDKSYRHLIEMCRDLIAPRLTVVQLNHWQTFERVILDF